MYSGNLKLELEPLLHSNDTKAVYGGHPSRVVTPPLEIEIRKLCVLDYLKGTNFRFICGFCQDRENLNLRKYLRTLNRENWFPRKIQENAQCLILLFQKMIEWNLNKSFSDITLKILQNLAGSRKLITAKNSKYSTGQMNCYHSSRDASVLQTHNRSFVSVAW